MTQSLASTARGASQRQQGATVQRQLCLVSSSRAAMVRTKPSKSTMRVRA